MWLIWQSACLAGTEPWVLVPGTAENQEWWQSLVIPAHSGYVGRGLSSNLNNVSFKGVSYLTLVFLNTLPLTSESDSGDLRSAWNSHVWGG